MPATLDPNKTTGATVDMYKDFGYDYPRGLDLKPTSQLHRKILTEVSTRASASSSEISKRYSTWREVDQKLTAYISLDDLEEKLEEQDDRKPLSIVVPYSYATLETLMTYFVSAFLEMPIFRYEGMSPEDMLGAILLEKVIEVHTLRSKVGLNLHTMFRDNFAYGFGVCSPIWTKRWGYRTTVKDTGFMSSIFGKWINTGGQQKVREETILFEGNALRNVDPYSILPDPTVPIHSLQDGEFFGIIESTNYVRLLEDERNSSGELFNVQYLSGVGNGRSLYNKKSSSGRDDKWGVSTNLSENITRPIDVIKMYITIIPKEWGLGDSEYPEKWLFAVASDKVVVSARPLNLDHNMFPIVSCATDFDGYSVSPVSRMEMVYGLQKALDWLFNSHISNVRKAINDMIVVDPYLINVADVRQPGPGKIIRTRRAAWGKGIENAIKQLPVTDVTRGHIQDAGFLIEIMKNVAGSVDAVMGLTRNTSDRVTAEEVRGNKISALSRLAKMAKVASMQAMQDIGYMFASHTQQLMSQELFVTTTGRWQEDLMKTFEGADRIKVLPADLLVDYDVVMRDGSIDTGEYSAAWTEMFKVMVGQPWLFQTFDMIKIFKHIARMLGAKNIEDFVLKKGMPNMQAQVLPDEEAMNMAQKQGMTAIGGM